MGKVKKFIFVIARLLPDRLWISILYRVKMGKKLDLKNPKSFNEKLQWLKLYDRRSEHIEMVDKYAAKQKVATLIGDEYIIPTLGIWSNVEDVNFDALPARFVLKCTHDSGGGTYARIEMLLI